MFFLSVLRAEDFLRRSFLCLFGETMSQNQLSAPFHPPKQTKDISRKNHPDFPEIIRGGHLLQVN
jgi:hypothetical protein